MLIKNHIVFLLKGILNICRKIIGLLFVSTTEKAKRIIILWPPFLRSDESIYNKLLDEFLFYCSNSDLHLLSIWQDEQGQLTGKVYSQNSIDSIPNIKKRGLPIIRMGKYRVIWKHSGMVRYMLKLIPNVYLMLTTPNPFLRYGYWHRLLYDYDMTLENGMRLGISTNYLARSKRERVAVICSGPSSELFLASGASQNFDEIILVNRAIYAENYYIDAKIAWLCAYDPILFSPADDSTPNFLTQLRKFIKDENHFFVTSVYIEAFLKTNNEKEIVSHSVFLDFLYDWQGWNIDLHNLLAVREVSNVTLSMALPLAATLANNIVIFGMDGAPEDSENNWEHNPAFQYNNPFLSDDVVRRSKFYQNTKKLIDFIRDSGVNVHLAAPSYNPGLQSIPIWSPGKK